MFWPFGPCACGRWEMGTLQVERRFERGRGGTRRHRRIPLAIHHPTRPGPAFAPPPSSHPLQVTTNIQDGVDPVTQRPSPSVLGSVLNNTGVPPVFIYDFTLDSPGARRGGRMGWVGAGERRVWRGCWPAGPAGVHCLRQPAPPPSEPSMRLLQTLPHPPCIGRLVLVPLPLLCPVCGRPAGRPCRARRLGTAIQCQALPERAGAVHSRLVRRGIGGGVWLGWGQRQPGRHPTTCPTHAAGPSPGQDTRRPARIPTPSPFT